MQQVLISFWLGNSAVWCCFVTTDESMWWLVLGFFKPWKTNRQITPLSSIPCRSTITPLPFHLQLLILICSDLPFSLSNMVYPHRFTSLPFWSEPNVGFRMTTPMSFSTVWLEWSCWCCGVVGDSSKPTRSAWWSKPHQNRLHHPMNIPN